MPTTLQIVHARDFVRTTPTGHLDWETTQRLFTAIAKTAAQLEGCDFLMDNRELSSIDLSDTQLWYLVQLLLDFDPIFRGKIAILLPEEASGDRARFFELCATNRGFRVKAFKQFEAAINWLSSQTEINPAD